MRARIFLLALAATLVTSHPAAAQATTPSPVARADVHGSAGWGNLRDEDASEWNRWDNRVGHASGAFGWYWSDHLKTEVELDVAGTATLYGYEQVESGGQVGYRGTRTDVRGTSIGLTQQVQFLRNAWVHPFIGAGVEFRHESRVRQVDPLILYDYDVRAPRELEPARRIELPDEWRPRGLAVVGLKAYFSTRAFARIDVKAAFRGGVEEVILRAGIGVDF